MRDTGPRRRGAIGRGAPLRIPASRPGWAGRCYPETRWSPGCLGYPHGSVARGRTVDLLRERQTVYRTLTPGAAAKPPESTAHKRYVRGAGLWAGGRASTHGGANGRPQMVDRCGANGRHVSFWMRRSRKTGDCFGAPEGKDRQAQELGSKDRDLQFYGVNH